MDLKEILAALSDLPEEKKQELFAEATDATKDMVWVPNPGPQTNAFFCEADEIFYGGQAGGGKLLNINTFLPTPTGHTTMGEVKIGDMLFDDKGTPCRVVAVSDITLSEDSYEVVFSDGTIIEADGGHLWHTWTTRDRDGLLSRSPEWKAKRRASRPSRAVAESKKPWVSSSITEINKKRVHEDVLPTGSVKTTSEILATLTVGDKGRLNHSIPVAGALQLPEAALPVEPYLLGLWLGDGISASGSIGMMADDLDLVLPNIERTLVSRIPVNVKPGRKPFDNVTFTGMRVDLRALGVLGDKRIPTAYLRASEEQRRELLRGILDTDGHCGSMGTIELSLSKHDLMEDVLELVNSLGILAAIHTKKLSEKNPKHNDSHRIQFTAPFPAFKLPRKAERQKLTGFRGSTTRRFITDIRPISPRLMRCVGIDAPSHLYLAGRSMVPTHNTDLMLGLALTEHKRSLVLRRTNKEAAGLAERMEQILGTRVGFNSQTGAWRYAKRVIDLGGCQTEEDKQKYKGFPHDLIAFDEVSDFSETQYSFIIGWNRSANPKQRCRIIAAGNPPTRPEGLWVLKRWAAWLDPTYPRPANPGEIRWFTTGEEGTEVEVQGRGPHLVNGEEVFARSRTFIPSQLSDNPDLAATDYKATLDSLPEELRAAYRDGNFGVGLRDDAFQVIPTEWVRLSQAAWTPRPPVGIPMCAIGVDVAQGGQDQTVLAQRYDGWFAPLIAVPGKLTPDGKSAAGIVMSNRRDNAKVITDLGGGWGGDCHAHLRENGIDSFGYMGVKPSLRRSADKAYKFFNTRAEAYWRLREALDPSQEHGSTMMLPHDAELVADLCAPTFEIVRPNIIKIESKEDVKKRIGRSPDKGDAVAMAWFDGNKQANIEGGWKGRKAAPKVVTTKPN